MKQPAGPVEPAKQPAVPAGPAKQAASPAGPGEDVLGWAINGLGVKTPAGSGTSGAAAPQGKTCQRRVARRSPAASRKGPGSREEGRWRSAADEGDLFAPPPGAGAAKTPAAGKAAADVAGPGAAKTPGEEETNPFEAPGTAAKGKSAANKPGSTAKSAAGKKAPAAKAAADETENPFGPDSSDNSGAGKKAGK